MRDLGLSALLPEVAWETPRLGAETLLGAALWSHFPAQAVSASRRSLFSGSTGRSALGLLLDGPCRPERGAGADARGPRAAARKCARPAVAGRCVRVACAAAWAMGRRVRARGRRPQRQQQQQPRPEGTEDGAVGDGRRNEAVGAGTKAGRGPSWASPTSRPEGAARGSSSDPEWMSFSFLRAGKAGTPRS